MSLSMITEIKERIHSQDKRTSIVRKNILLSALCKLIGMVVSFLIVPATLGYLHTEQFGVWMTISSMLMWFSFFDVGLGNGMRNYLTSAISKGDFYLGRTYLTTTLGMLTIIALVLGGISLIITETVDSSAIFNTTKVDRLELKGALQVAVFFTLVAFVIKNIGLVFVALQKYALYDMLSAVGLLVSLAAIYALRFFSERSILYVVVIFTIIPIIIYILSAIPLFIRYPMLKPTLKSFNLNLSKQILWKGIGFFIIQITSCLVIFGGSNFFITQISGPEAVTTYNIAYKYFNLLAIGYTIIISPMWNAYTDAYVKEDFPWIRKTFKRAIGLWMISVILGGLMLLLSSYFYTIWIGNNNAVPFHISALVLCFISFFNLNNCVTYLLNGLNKIRVQIYTSVITTIIYIIYLYLNLSSLTTETIIMSTAICYALMSSIHLYQCSLIINKKAYGYWNK